MNIVYAYDGDWPRGATRVAKQTEALLAAGHGVTLISRNETRGPRRSVENGMEVRRLPALPTGLLNKAANFPYPFNPLWSREITRAAEECDADAIFAYDLPIAPTCARVAKNLGLPLLYDMAEVYPLFLQGLWDFDELGLFSKWVRNPSFAQRVEDWVLPRCDRIFVVTEESRDRCMRRGIDGARIDVIGNTPANADHLAAPQPKPQAIEALGDRPVIVFTGILIGDRGVVGAVTAMTTVLAKHPNAVLLIVGDGPEAPAIREMVANLGLEDSVIMTGWQKHEQLAAFIQHSHVGLLPFKDGIHIRITLANKLFDYMGAGIPFVATDVPPMRRIAEETGAGLLFRPGEGVHLAERIVELLDDPEHAKERGRRGQEAVQTKYRWEVDAKRLVQGTEAAVNQGTSHKAERW